jgi:glucan phosphoethanolaminetransferase (alkaline phosphatase superfamily)
MINFLRRVMNTDFLPMNEVRKIKVVLVMAFLLVVTAATIIFAIFFDYPLVVKIVAMAVFALGSILIFVLVKFNRIMAPTVSTPICSSTSRSPSSSSTRNFTSS